MESTVGALVAIPEVESPEVESPESESPEVELSEVKSSSELARGQRVETSAPFSTRVTRRASEVALSP